MGKSFIFDLESDGLLRQMSQIHCLHLKDIATGEILRFDEDDVSHGVELLQNADNIIGHNVIGFDIPAIKLIFPEFAPTGIIRDTLIYSQILFSNIKDSDYQLVSRGVLPRALIGRHSLKAHGYRQQMLKGDYADVREAEGRALGITDKEELHQYVWGEWRQDMSDYCVTDVEVTSVLWDKIRKKNTSEDNKAILEEHRVHVVFQKMQSDGFPIDLKKAHKLVSELEPERDKLESRLKKHFGSWYMPKKIHAREPAWETALDADKKLFIDTLRKPKATGAFSAFLRDCGKNKVYLPREDPRIWYRFNKAMTTAWDNSTTPQKQVIMNALREHGVMDKQKCQCDAYVQPAPVYGEDTSRRWWAQATTSKVNRTYKELYTTDDNGNRVYKHSTTKGATFCHIVRKDFNPGSRQQIVNRFTTIYDWKPTEFTEKGSPSVNADVLETMPITSKTGQRIAKELSDFFYYKKLLGQISTGKGAWLKSVSASGMSHCSTNASGTVTGRCSHSRFNIGQVPAVSVAKYNEKTGQYMKGSTVLTADQYELTSSGSALIKSTAGRHGYECRDMFIPHHGYKMVGADLKSLELRCLAEVCSKYDNGELIKIVLGGNIHDINYLATGVDSRDIAKRCIFALIYGSGDWKLGHTAYPMAPDADKIGLGKEIRGKLMKSVPGLAMAIDAIKAEAAQGFVRGIDGRRLHVRAVYAALNTKLQGMGAAVAKRWAVITIDNMVKKGYPIGLEHSFWTLMAHIHDEMQSSAKEDIVDVLMDVQKTSAIETGQYYDMNCIIEADTKSGWSWKDTH